MDGTQQLDAKTSSAYVETYECAGCQEQMKGQPDWMVTRDTTFCDACWQSITPFQRGLIRAVIDAGDRIRDTLSESLSEITQAIEGATSK
jgi:hypothetical protein